MKSFLKSFLPLSVVILVFASCGKNNGAGNMIPDDAMFVAQVNTKSLESKLPWDDIKQTSWFKKMSSESSLTDWRKTILDNPSATGIDFNEGLVIFMAENAPTRYYVASEGKLKDAAAFEQFNKNMDSSQAVRKEGEINFLTLKNKNVVGWNSDHFIYVMNKEANPYESYKWNDSTHMPSVTDPVDHTAELTALCKKLFSLKRDSSLAKNDKFATLLKETGDIHVWQNTEAIIKNSSAMDKLAMMKLDAFTKDNVSTYTVNFDNGKIDISQKGYVSKELSDILSKYMGSSLNMDMIKNIPSQDVFGLLAVNFKPAGLVEMIKLTGADGLVNSFTQQMGFNLDDVGKATNGDLLLAFSDLKATSDSAAPAPGFSAAFPGMNYIFSVGIGDKASLQKILDAVKKMGANSGEDSMIHYVMNDKTFAIGSSPAFANEYLNGKSNHTYDFADKFSGHPAGFYVDIHKILSFFSGSHSSDPADQAMMTQSLAMWNNIIAYGGEFKDNAYSFHAEINLVNKDTGSLKQLNHYIDEMYTITQSKKESNTNRLDSLLVPPPIDTVKVK